MTSGPPRAPRSRRRRTPSAHLRAARLVAPGTPKGRGQWPPGTPKPWGDPAACIPARAVPEGTGPQALAPPQHPWARGAAVGGWAAVSPRRPRPLAVPIPLPFRLCALGPAGKKLRSALTWLPGASRAGGDEAGEEEGTCGTRAPPEPATPRQPAAGGRAGVSAAPAGDGDIAWRGDVVAPAGPAWPEVSGQQVQAAVPAASLCPCRGHLPCPQGQWHPSLQPWPPAAPLPHRCGSGSPVPMSPHPPGSSNPASMSPRLC